MMINALRDAGITPAQMAYINANARGTSTPTGDKAETQEVKAVFAESAGKAMASSTKSMTGHLLGAVGVIEAIFSMSALRDQADSTDH